MDTAILAGVATVVVIAVVSRLSQRSQVGAPLLLVLIGIVASFLPFLPDVAVEPEIILSVVLPPLLFSSAVSMPAMNFRREFTTIAALAVVLVLASSIIMGIVFHLVIPEVALPWCIALGAILSPTDAVATSIARKAGISSRVSAILDGESLLNDATSLVTLRTAIAAAAASFSVWEAIGHFVYSVTIAVVIGYLVGRLGVWARTRARVPTVSTALSLTVPFAASVPADMLGASGLVAAVMAGIVTGRGRGRAFLAEQRISDRTMWLTTTLVLEGTVFLIMGLELRHLLHAQRASIDATANLWMLTVGAFAVLVLMLIIRALFLLPLTRLIGRKAARLQATRPQLEATREALANDRTLSTDRKRRRNRRALSDIDYYLRKPMTPRDAAVMVVGGMRGVVTLAAAQTLPAHTPHRSSLILIAFAVAVFSLLIQGGLLGRFVTWIKPSRPDPEDIRRQRESLAKTLEAVTVAPRADEAVAAHRLRTISARRNKVLDLVDVGIYDAECTTGALAALDAQELSLLLHDEDDVKSVREEDSDL